MSLLPAIPITSGGAGKPVVLNNGQTVVGNAGDSIFWSNNTEHACQIVQLVNGQPATPPLTGPISPGSNSTEAGLAPSTATPKVAYTFTYGALIKQPDDTYKWDNSQGTVQVNLQP